MTGTFSAYSNILEVLFLVVNLIHISQPFMNPSLSTLTCVFTQVPVCGKEAHAGKMLKKRKHEKFPIGFV